MTARHGADVDRAEEWAALREQHLRSNLAAAGVATNEMSGSSIYFAGPDGERLELIKDTLGEMYGTKVS